MSIYETMENKDYLDGVSEYYNYIRDTLTIKVRKNHLTKRAFKIGFLNDKLKNKKTFALLARYFRFNFNLDFSPVYKGFILEEIEYVPDEKINHQKLQEEYLKNNNVKKLEDGGYKLDDKERVSKSHRDSFNNETIIEYKLAGLTLYGTFNQEYTVIPRNVRKNTISGKIKTMEVGKTISIGRIEYYSLVYTDYNGELKFMVGRSRVKYSTIIKMLELGILSHKPKENIVNSKGNKYTIVNIDDDDWDTALI